MSAGSRVVRPDGSVGVLPGGSVAIFSDASPCPVCCDPSGLPPGVEPFDPEDPNASCCDDPGRMYVIKRQRTVTASWEAFKEVVNQGGGVTLQRLHATATAVHESESNSCSTAELAAGGMENTSQTISGEGRFVMPSLSIDITVPMDELSWTGCIFSFPGLQIWIADGVDHAGPSAYFGLDIRGGSAPYAIYERFTIQGNLAPPTYVPTPNLFHSTNFFDGTAGAHYGAPCSSHVQLPPYDAADAVHPGTSFSGSWALNFVHSSDPSRTATNWGVYSFQLAGIMACPAAMAKLSATAQSRSSGIRLPSAAETMAVMKSRARDRDCGTPCLDRKDVR